jgi:outer membrane receptor protein involved in Fe transport
MKGRRFDGFLTSTAAAFVVIGQLLVIAPAQAEDKQPAALEEIVVTARFREQSAQEVGQSISVLSSDQLASLGIEDISDIVRATPGLDFAGRGPGRNLPSIRGLADVQRLNDQVQTPNLITQFVDEIPATALTANQPDIPLFDLDRVEIVKGPQPTYFGEGSVGGSVRYFLKNPSLTREEFRSRAEISHTDGSGGVNYIVDSSAGLPLIDDKLGVRFTVYRKADAGFIDNATIGRNDVNDSTTTGGTAVLLAKPVANLTARFSALYQKAVIDFSPIASAPVQNLVQGGPGLLPFPAPNAAHDDLLLLSGKLTYTAGPVTLESVSGYYDRKFDQLFVDRTQSFAVIPALFRLPPANAVALNDQKDDNFTQELRFLSNFDFPLNVVGGVYYADTKNTTSQGETSPAFIPATGSDFYFNASVPISGRQLSTFGELQLSLLDKRLRLTAGARHFSQKFTSPIIGAIELPVGGSIRRVTFPQLLGDPNATFRNKIEKTLPKGEIEYDLAPGVLVYGSIAEGARNGLFNSPANVAVGGLSQAQFSTYGPDSVVAYELGLKSSLLQHRLHLNLAVYDNEWKDIQTPFTAPGGVGIVANGPKARTRGGELDSSFTANQYLTVFANAGYTQAKFTETRTLALGGMTGTTITPDTRIPNVPDWKLNLGLEGRLPAALTFGDVVGSAVYQYTGSEVVTAAGQEPIAAYGLVNLRLGVENARWSASFYVDNAFNKITTIYINPPLALGENYVNRPRTVGLVTRFSF